MPAPANLVHETTTGTGTGTLDLVNEFGKRSFSAAFSTGGTNVFDYFISHRSAAEWEIGTGHMSDSDTLVRDTVLASSNSNNAVNFSAGTKDVTNDVLAGEQNISGLTEDTAPDPTADFIHMYDTSASARKKVKPSNLVRPKLTANRTYYVRSDGSDSNDGLTDSSGGAKLTVMGALNAIAQVDINGFIVTVSAAASTTFSGQITIPQMTGQAGVANLVIQGGGATTIFTANTGFQGTIRATAPGAMATITNCKVENSNALGIAFQATNGGFIKIGATVEVGTTGYVMQSSFTGIIESTSGLTVSANATYLFWASSHGLINASGGTYALGTRTFTTTAFADGGAYIRGQSVTFTGTVTATRYNATLNAVIDSQGGGANAFPGNVAGTTSTGGQYGA